MEQSILDSVLCVMVKPCNAKQMRSTLSQLGVMDTTKKATTYGQVVAIPITEMAFKHFTNASRIWPYQNIDDSLISVCITCGKISQITQEATSSNPSETCQCIQFKSFGFLNNITFHVAKIPLEKIRKKRLSPSQRLEDVLLMIFDNKKIPINDDMKEKFPKNWEIHGDLVLFPSNCFNNDIWNSMTVEDWQKVLVAVGGKRLARSRGGVHSDGFRTPNVELLLGDSGWVQHIDNGIRYSFDITKCMFSSGNITEKIRVANMNCDGETIVDLYAGIGYFTLPYLVHANAAFVHACEWNPNAIAALKRNLVLNKVQDRCTVYEGDNRQICPSEVADRVNLGLIPSSGAGWPVACKALKKKGGILHIHGNVTSLPATKNSSSLPQSSKLSMSPFVPESNALIDNSLAIERDVQMTESSLSYAFSVGHLEDKNLPSCNPENVPTKKAIPTCNLSNTSSTVANVKAQTSVDTSAHSSNDCHMLPDKKNSQQQSWKNWSYEVSQQIRQLCIEIKGGDWSTHVLHIEQVKSYAPHIDHVVVDLECRPIKPEETS
ncbi:tRNA wybutosine-synthesizing protein 2 homolog [Antedon mediterranea]|uniref:tRNA wybutosine-synthesizing protein 2 homolog n=1 Tax=Antedon mediterranea TaxID=105859 RepID=UPI003AF41014